MSRRRPDRRTARQLARAQWVFPVEVICTGRGAHAREFFERVDVSLEGMDGLTDDQLAELEMSDHRMLYLFTGRRGLRDEHVHLVEGEGESHQTRTWRCEKCGRTIPRRDVKLRRQLALLARHGIKTVDLSRLDRA